MQTANAFGQVQNALSVFVTLYRSIAEWRAVIERLHGFEQSVAAARPLSVTPPVIEVARRREQAVAFKDLVVRLPTACRWSMSTTSSIAPASRCWSPARPAPASRPCSARSPGSGRSARDASSCPKNAQSDDSAAAAVFPDRDARRGRRLSGGAGRRTMPARLPKLIAAVGLPALAERIDEEAHWNRMLSLGEQQRLGIARALLHAPDYLFLDEATASLDEAAEAALYRLWKRGCRMRRSSRSAIARRSPPSTSGVSPSRSRVTCAFSARRVSRARRRNKKRRPEGRRFLMVGRRHLLQVSRSQINRKLGDEGRSAPVRARAGVDCSHIRCSRRCEIAGERVAIALAQIGVDCSADRS